MPNVSAFDDDIIITEYPAHASVTLGAIEEEFRKRLELNASPHLLLVKLHGLSIFHEDAQRFLASEKHAALTKAVGILCDRKAGYYEHGKVLIEHFKTAQALTFPVKLFDDEHEALAWLKSKNE